MPDPIAWECWCRTVNPPHRERCSRCDASRSRGLFRFAASPHDAPRWQAGLSVLILFGLLLIIPATRIAACAFFLLLAVIANSVSRMARRP